MLRFLHGAPPAHISTQKKNKYFRSSPRFFLSLCIRTKFVITVCFYKVCLCVVHNILLGPILSLTLIFHLFSNAVFLFWLPLFGSFHVHLFSFNFVNVAGASVCIMNAIHALFFVWRCVCASIGWWQQHELRLKAIFLVYSAHFFLFVCPRYCILYVSSGAFFFVYPFHNENFCEFRSYPDNLFKSKS